MPRNQFGPFSLDLPSGYGLSNVFLTASDPNAGSSASGFSPNIVVSTEAVPDGTTAEAFWAAQRGMLQQAGVPAADFEEPESVEIADGSSGLLGEQVVTSPARDRIRQLQLCVIRDNVAHLLVASHLDGPPFDRLRAEFRQVLLSFA